MNFDPLESVEIFTSKSSFKASYILNDGITCPPDPPVAISIFFIS